MDCAAYMPRKHWDLSFLAQPKEVAVARRLVGTCLGDWGLHELIDPAQMCVSELVSNVIAHVGRGTPVSLAVTLIGSRLRIEVGDPDPRALPTLVDASDDAEAGRGMALVDALTESWGVQLHTGSKVTWCELATASLPNGHDGGAHVARAAEVLSHYGNGELFSSSPRSRLSAMAAEAAAIDVIADLLHWLKAHGHDADEALDRAQTRFEGQLDGAGG